jgi:GT2 family glycosyltransferase
MRNVSVVIPTYRRPRTLAQTLDALLRLDFSPVNYEIFVVDDGVDSETEAVVRELTGGPVALTYLAGARRGAGAARNAGAQRAEGEVLLFCDDDIIVEPEHLRLHLRAREKHEDALVSGVRWYEPSVLAALEATPFGRYRVKLERRFEDARDGRALEGGRVETERPYSCNLALRAEAFRELGGFDERFPYAGAEDQDFGNRAQQAGYPVIRDHAIKLLHNDPVIDFGAFCAREETGAIGVVLLAEKYPAVADSPMIRENAPIARGDGPRITLKKVFKAGLSNRMALGALHGAIRGLEWLRVHDAVLHRTYRAVIGLHIYRGIRSAL